MKFSDVQNNTVWVTCKVSLVFNNNSVQYIFSYSYQDSHVFLVTSSRKPVKIEFRIRNTLISYKWFLYTYNYCIKAPLSFKYEDCKLIFFAPVLLWHKN